MSSADDARWFELSFPSDLDEPAVTAFLRSLVARGRSRGLGRDRPVIFETSVSGRRWTWRIGTVDSDDAAAVLQQLRIHLPQVGYRQTPQPIDKPPQDGVELRTTNSHRAARTDIAGAASASILGAFGDVGNKETLTLQWIVGPSHPQRPVPNPRDATSGLLDHPSGVFDGEAVRAKRAKQTEPIYGVVGRIAVRAASRSRRRQLLRRAFGSLKIVRRPGVGFARRLIPLRAVAGRVQRRAVPVIEWPCPLNAGELTAVLGWPIGGPTIEGVTYRTSRLLPAPRRAVLDNEAIRRDPTLRSINRALGEATFPGSSGQLVLRPADATRHFHVLGPSGSGKSTLLASLIAQDIAAGRGVAVIEPKSDLIRATLERIPESRRDDVVVLDAGDAIAPVGINPLQRAVGAGRELAVDQLLGLLHATWRDSWGPRTNDVLHAGLLTLAGLPDASLVALPSLFTNDSFRRRAVAQAVARDPFGLSDFWAWFDSLTPEHRAQVLGPAMSRLRTFLMRPSMRAILGQTSPRFSMHQVFTQRKILLVDLAESSTGPEASALLGSMVVAELWRAVQTRSRIPSERRHPMSVYIDEFQSYTNLTTDFADLLVRARGLGAAMTLSHQHLQQLTGDLREAVLANAQSRVIFRLGHRDARVMAEGHPELTPDDISGLGPFEIYASLVTDGHVTPYASGHTSPLTDAISDPARVRLRSRRSFGVSAQRTDDELRRLLGADIEAPTDLRNDPDEFGVRRRPS